VSYKQPLNDRTDPAAGAPPGWCLDPEGRHELRRWDGARWESGPQDGAAFLSGLAADPYADSLAPAQPEQPSSYHAQLSQDPYQLQKSAHVPGPQPQAHYAPRRGNSKIPSVLIALGALVVIIITTSPAIGRVSSSWGHVAGTSAAAGAAPSTTARPVTCDSIASWMQPVVSDQASQDASDEQNWVELVPFDSGRSNLTDQGQDLQNASSMAQNAPGGSALGADLQAFATGANAFLTNEDQGVYPGSNSYYQPLRTDIYAISRLCGWPSSS
jgi:hypothetical protein